MKLTQSVYASIVDHLATERFDVERAGILLGPRDEDELGTHYIRDFTGTSTETSFTLNAADLNDVISKAGDQNLDCKGIVHSHPPGTTRPSSGDLEYVTKLFMNPKNTSMQQILFPIVCNGRLYPFVIDSRRPQTAIAAELVLV